MFDIKDKVAVVTGAGGGIGLATAKAILAKGGKVVICDILKQRGEEALKELDPKRAAFMACDVSKEEDVKALVQFAVDKFGRLDVMVANAGLANEFLNGTDVSFEEYKRVIGVNQFGVMLCMKYGVAQMLKQGTKGAVVCTASIEGFIGEAHLLPYNATKGAVIQMVKSEALARAKNGIRVNAVAPGYVDTNLVNRKAMGDKRYDSLAAKHPLGRLGTADEIAHGMIFCIENEFVTGTTILVDGGYTAQ